MKIALVAEGTYPVAYGGVSTWCDQLLRGIPEHEWVVIGLTPTGQEEMVWSPPPSVSSVVLKGVWAPEPSAAPWRWRGSARRERVEDALQRLWSAAFAPEGEAAVSQMEVALRELIELSTGIGLANLLAARGSTAALLAGWRAHCSDLPPMSVAEAVAVSRVVDRTLAVIDTPMPTVDLVHAAGNGAAALLGLAAYWRRGTPMLLSEHGVYLRERYLALDGAGFSWIERRAITSLLRRVCEVAYRVAEQILPVSDFNRRWILRLGADAERVTTIRNGVPPERYTPVGEEPAVPTLSFVGRIDPLKDLQSLVRAFAIVRAELPSARLRVFGPVPAGNEAYHASVTRLVADLSLTGAVTFEGPSAGSRPAIEAGSLVVLSSISEGLPYTVIEAMMCGRATVSTDVGGVGECLDPEQQAGLLVPARDPQAFAEACVRLLADDDERRRMAAAARRHALATATLDRMLAAYRAVYSSTAGRRRQGSRAARPDVGAPARRHTYVGVAS